MEYVEKAGKVGYDEARKGYFYVFGGKKEKNMEMDVKKFGEPCSCGRTHHIEVKDVILGKEATDRLLEALKTGELSGYSHPVIVCDENTKAAALEKMNEIWGLCGEVLLPSDHLHADNRGVGLVEEALEKIKETDLLLAVGSGTIQYSAKM